MSPITLENHKNSSPKRKNEKKENIKRRLGWIRVQKAFVRENNAHANSKYTSHVG